jgi:hypothetical protein
LVALISCSGKQGFEAGSASSDVRHRADTPPSEETPEPDQEVGDENLTVNEPVAVGGAFLTCEYPVQQDQADARTLLYCQLKDLPEELAIETVSAQFDKVNPQGEAYPLTILNHDREEMSWLLVETAQTAFFELLRAKVFINGSEPFEFEMVTEASYSITPNLTFWLYC